jgi:hypothetical protein
MMYDLPALSKQYASNGVYSIPFLPTKHSFAIGTTQQPGRIRSSSFIKSPHLPQLTLILRQWRLNKFDPDSKIIENETVWSRFAAKFDTIVTPVGQKENEKTGVSKRKKSEYMLTLGEEHNLIQKSCEGTVFGVWTPATGEKECRCMKCISLYPFKMVTEYEGQERSKQIVPSGQCCEARAAEILYTMASLVPVASP